MQTTFGGVVRDINRRIILNLILTRQPISRADLARASVSAPFLELVTQTTVAVDEVIGSVGRKTIETILLLSPALGLAVCFTPLYKATNQTCPSNAFSPTP